MWLSFFLKEVIKVKIKVVGDGGSQRLVINKNVSQSKEQVDAKVLLEFNNFRKCIGFILL